MTDLVEVSSSMRFAAAARQWSLERLMGAGDATASDMLEQSALRAARYWESFRECYSANEVDAGCELVAACTASTMVLVDGAYVSLFSQSFYLELVQRCADLVAESNLRSVVR